MVHSEASEIEGARRERRIEGTSWFLAVSTKPPEGLPEMGLGILMGNVLFMAFFGAVTWLTYGSSPEFVGENTGSSSLFRGFSRVCRGSWSCAMWRSQSLGVPLPVIALKGRSKTGVSSRQLPTNSGEEAFSSM